jgi:3-oxoacyl-[acyl-carrier-protein] synthase-3
MATLISSASALGSNRIPSQDVDREFGMPIGKLRKRAGIVSIARAAADETETTLAAKAVTQALAAAGCSAQELDWIFATSETHQGYPSLGAQLHSLLLARETCGVLDLGGACLGLLNAFAAARNFLAAGGARAILVLTADVHSRTLTPRRVAGEFGGLFGDGASAFLLQSSARGKNPYQLGDFHFGCAGQYADAIRVAPAESGALEVKFDGEALSRAAVSRMEKIIHDLELRSGFSLEDVAAFATHQPNPRLVDLLARQLRVPPEKFPPIAKECGNLGSTTCAAALHTALIEQGALPAASRKPIFLASLGPGLLFGGGWIHPVSGDA